MLEILLIAVEFINKPRSSFRTELPLLYIATEKGVCAEMEQDEAT